MTLNFTTTELKAISAMILFVTKDLGTELQTRTGYTEADFAGFGQILLTDTDISKDEKSMKMIQSLLNEVCNGISISDEDFFKMFGMTRADAEAVGEKIK